jgi:hypothetical protein
VCCTYSGGGPLLSHYETADSFHCNGEAAVLRSPVMICCTAASVLHLLGSGFVGFAIWSLVVATGLGPDTAVATAAYVLPGSQFGRKSNGDNCQWGRGD